MPAAAVIPAPIAYTNVVAVKKLVVGFLMVVGCIGGPAARHHTTVKTCDDWMWLIHFDPSLNRSFTLRKLECSKQALCLNMLAWNNSIGLHVLFVGCSRTRVMIDRDGWGHPYSQARGEILGPWEDEQLRKRLPRTFSLIKNESWWIEDDQIPS